MPLNTCLARGVKLKYLFALNSIVCLFNEFIVGEVVVKSTCCLFIHICIPTVCRCHRDAVHARIILVPNRRDQRAKAGSSSVFLFHFLFKCYFIYIYIYIYIYMFRFIGFSFLVLIVCMRSSSVSTAEPGMQLYG